MYRIPALVLTVIFLACSKEEITPREYPRVHTDEISNQGADLMFSGEIIFTSVPIKDHGFLWSVYSSVLFDNSEKISLGAKTGSGTFEARCDGNLKPGAAYYIRSYAISEKYTVFGNVVKFVR